MTMQEIALMISSFRTPRAAVLLLCAAAVLCLAAPAAWSAPTPISAGGDRIVDRGRQFRRKGDAALVDLTHDCLHDLTQAWYD